MPGADHAEPDGSRLPTIVIVDDAAEVRALVRTRLRMSGKVEVVAEGANGVEAIAAAREHRPDLVLLDVSMPIMDGLEALPAILEASPGTQVAMYSGFQEHGLAERARELGAVAFLEKSTALETLAADLLAVLAGTATATAPVTEPPVGGDDLDARLLREHLERFREVFEDAAIGMATVTLAGQVVRANHALADLLERPVDGLVGAAYAGFTGDPSQFAALLDGVLNRGERVQQLEHDVPGADPPRRVLTTLAPVLDSADRPLYLFAQVQDVTAQRGAEEELRRSELRFRLLVEAVGDYAIFMLSPEGLVGSWNTGAERIKGYAADEIIGRHFRIFYPPEVKAAGHPEHELELAIRDGHYEEEGWRIRKDGSRFWANVLITPVRDRSGTLVGFAKVTRDNSERRAMLAQLQQAAEDQAHFLAVTAHELRTPVSVLAGTADMLALHGAELGEEERDQLLAGMGSSAARLRRLLTDLLTASRLQGSRLELELRPVDVGELAEACAGSARQAHSEAEILVEAEPGLEVLGDFDRLAQAVDNLVGNAARHGASPVLISARGTGDTVEIAVRDAGAGVPESMRGRLFERFATGQTRGGTGLGLYIVRQLARAHDGEASYVPEDRQGGEPGGFVITLPRTGAR